jgi:hypothetical protein
MFNNESHEFAGKCTCGWTLIYPWLVPITAPLADVPPMIVACPECDRPVVLYARLKEDL